MLTKGAVEDLIMQYLRPGPGGKASSMKKVPEIKRRVFLSDWQLRRVYKAGAKTVTVPANAIISPLSLDWLDYNGVTVIRE